VTEVLFLIFFSTLIMKQEAAKAGGDEDDDLDVSVVFTCLVVSNFIDHFLTLLCVAQDEEDDDKAEDDKADSDAEDGKDSDDNHVCYCRKFFLFSIKAFFCSRVLIHCFGLTCRMSSRW
jgi:hypothetical protein